MKVTSVCQKSRIGRTAARRIHSAPAWFSAGGLMQAMGRLRQDTCDKLEVLLHQRGRRQMACMGRTGRMAAPVLAHRYISLKEQGGVRISRVRVEQQKRR